MQNTNSPKKALLGELESIVDILDDNEQVSSDFFDMDKHTDEILDIPLLNDVVDQENTEEPSTLFDLDRIFSDEEFPPAEQIAEQAAPQIKAETEAVYSKLNDSDEEQSEMFPVPSLEATQAPDLASNQPPEPDQPRQVNLHQSLDLVIQELVDEFVPVLENRLREQLSALSPEIIQQLAEKHLNQ